MIQILVVSSKCWLQYQNLSSLWYFLIKMIRISVVTSIITTICVFSGQNDPNFGFKLNILFYKSKFMIIFVFSIQNFSYKVKNYDNFGIFSSNDANFGILRSKCS